MMHGAWCWDVHFLDYFAQHGFAAHAVDLRGHGGSEGRKTLRWTRIADFVEDVARTVRQLPRPPVLIGHSMGGFVILDMVALDRPKPRKMRTHLLVLGVGRDNMLAPAEIAETARAYRTQFEIIPDVAHNSMLEARWETVAERILAWVRERAV